MARKRSSETELAVTGATAAVPARRKTTIPTRTRKTSSASIPPAASVAQTNEATAVYELPHQEVAALAYSFWADRGYQGGSPEEDWLRAERELRMATSTVTA